MRSSSEDTAVTHGRKNLYPKRIITSVAMIIMMLLLGVAAGINTHGASAQDDTKVECTFPNGAKATVTVEECATWSQAAYGTDNGSDSGSGSEGDNSGDTTTDRYPLAGQAYASNLGDSAAPRNDPYYSRWEANGRLWQPKLPAQRGGFEVTFDIVPGTYIYNGVACTLSIDEERTGGDGVVMGDHENGLEFTVASSDGKSVKGHVVCDDAFNSGFEIVLTSMATADGGETPPVTGTPAPTAPASATCTVGSATYTLDYDPAKGVLYMDNFLTDIRTANETKSVTCTLVTTVPGTVQIHGGSVEVPAGTVTYTFPAGSGTDLGFNWTKSS